MGLNTALLLDFTTDEFGEKVAAELNLPTYHSDDGIVLDDVLEEHVFISAHLASGIAMVLNEQGIVAGDLRKFFSIYGEEAYGIGEEMCKMLMDCDMHVHGYVYEERQITYGSLYIPKQGLLEAMPIATYLSTLIKQ